MLHDWDGISGVIKGAISVNQFNTPAGKRLFNLLDTIIGEEQNFKRGSRDAATASEKRQQSKVGDTSVHENLERIRRAHDALFEIHRRFVGEHELVIQRCFTISRQARAGLLSEDEMAMEIERLQRDLNRIKQEHEQVERECREFMDAHRDFLDGLGPEL